MKTCSDCAHYYLDGELCEAPMPLWVGNIDPMDALHGDEQRHLEPEHNANKCKMFRKRRGPNKPIEPTAKDGGS